jgi:hypothetical protein
MGCSSSKEPATKESKPLKTLPSDTVEPAAAAAASSQPKAADTTPTTTTTTAATTTTTAPAMSDDLKHNAPDGDCAVCCEDLTSDNFVEYQASAGSEWLKAPYCEGCIESYFVEKLWQKYMDDLAKADCAAALKRVLTTPPPMNVRDAGFPCGDNGAYGEVYRRQRDCSCDVHLCSLWVLLPRWCECSCDGSFSALCTRKINDKHTTSHTIEFYYHSKKATAPARVKGSLEGDERMAFWAEKKAFMTATEHEEETAKKEKKKEKEASAKEAEAAAEPDAKKHKSS